MTNKRFGALVACLSAALFLFGCSHDLDSIGLPGGDLTRDLGADLRADLAPDASAPDKGADGAGDSAGWDLASDLAPDLTLDGAAVDQALPDLAQLDAIQPDLAQSDLVQPDQGICLTAGGACDDGNPCTHTDKCVTIGSCKGTTYSCNDLISCTTDTCLNKPPTQGGCKNEVKTSACHIGGICKVKGDANSSCAECDPSFSQHAWAPKKGQNCVVKLTGSGGGMNNGTLGSAKFNYPTGIAVDSAGAVYVADWKNHRVRMIAKGKVSTLAGGSAGHKDGNAATARFENPYDVDVDSSGTVYVAEMGGNSAGQNHYVRAISAGTVSTFAGGGKIYIKDGLKTEWKFWKVLGLAVGLQGKLYATDNFHHLVVEIWGANIKLLAGYRDSAFLKGVKGGNNGSPTNAKFQYPRGLALGPGGVVYVADAGNGSVRKIQPGITVTTVKSGLSGPQDLAVDLSNGNIYVAESGAHKIHVIDKNGGFKLLAGTGGVGVTDGPGATAKFSSPTGLAVDKNGYLFVADRANHRIRVINPN